MVINFPRKFILFIKFIIFINITGFIMMFVNNFVKNTILVTSLIAVTKHLRKEETILSHGPRAQSIPGRKPRWQESEAAAHISSAGRKQ